MSNLQQSPTQSLSDRLSSARKNFSPPSEEERAEFMRRVIAHCHSFQGPQLSRSLTQAGLSLALYAAIIAGMMAATINGLWYIVVLLAPFAAGMLVKLFIIQHDCGHGSYFKTKNANHALGFFISLLTFTPYGYWRDAHNQHHATSGDLGRRGAGAVDTLTVEEYQSLPRLKRAMYQFYRHPAVIIGIGAPFYFIVMQRFPIGGPMPFVETYKGFKVRDIWKSVILLDAALILVYGAFVFAFGWGPVLAAFLPAVAGASCIGSWMFFVQHQYEDAYWAERPEWNFAEAALFGSSHYDLPMPLRWITGNIGLHHIHHLASRIPNYRLMECFKTSQELMSMPRMTMLDSLRSPRLALWDAAKGKMVSFRAAKAG